MKWIVSIGVILMCLLIAGSFSSLLAVDEQRQAYDKMVEEATKEADEYVQEKQNEMKAVESEAQAQQDAAFDERVQAEQARIQAEMETVQGRGLSATFTQGMKDNQLQELQEKLDQLMSDPEAYFGG